MLSGYLLSLHNVLSFLLAAVWLPIIVLFYLKLVCTGRWWYCPIVAALIACQFLAGSVEVVIMTFMTLFGLTIFAVSFRPESSRCDGVVWSLGARLKAFLAVLFFFILLSSVQLLPFLELKNASVRAMGLSYQEATAWSLQWRDFLQCFLPDPFGRGQTLEKYWSHQSWLKNIYFGIQPFIFAVFYFVSKDRRHLFFASIMAASLLLALGGNTPLYRLVYAVPPFDSLRYPVKFTFLFVFALSLVAGLGLDAFVKHVALRTNRVLKIVKFLFFLGFACALCWGFSQSVPDAGSPLTRY